MAKEEAIRRAIKELVGKTTNGGTLMEGKVNSVDWDKRTCEVALEDGRVLPAVRLKSIADDKDTGFCVKPKKDSVVLVATVGEETEQFVCGFNEVETIELKMQEVELVIDGGKVKLKAKKIAAYADETVFNGGKNKGLAVIDKIAARCNDFEKALNEIKTVFQSHTHHVTGIGAPTGTTASPLTYNVPNSTGSDFENDKVKH